MGMVRLEQVCNVARQLLNDGRVEALDVLEHALVLARGEVDGHTLAAKAARAADAVQVVLRLGGQVVVNHKRHLLHVDAAREQVGGDEHARRARAELAHDDVARVLVHVSMGGRHGVVATAHLVGEPVHLAARVAENHALRDGQRLVEVAQRVELPLLAVDVHVELLDTLQSELVALHQNAHRLVHELARDLQRLGRHGRREHANLQVGGQQLEDVVDLILEPTAEHLVGLVQAEHLDRARVHRPTTEHVIHTTGGAHHHVHAALQDALVLAHRRATHARVALDRQVVAQGAHDLLDLLRQLARRRQHQRLHLSLLVVDVLQDARAERRRLASARLRLLDHVQLLGKGHNAALLNRRGLLETVRVDAAQQVLVQAHGVERLVHLVPGGDGVLALKDLAHLLVVLLVIESRRVRHVCLGGRFGRWGGVAMSLT
mmetsp:Transcript_3805/g.11859  ORF Transcript_3805/g.11859 Transcript_3805/m.11859 type:complete len:432 (+) Transcript_3805:100-1395(+)